MPNARSITVEPCRVVIDHFLFVVFQMLEVLMALSILEDPERKAAVECTKEALKFAENYSIIKKNPDK